MESNEHGTDRTTVHVTGAQPTVIGTQIGKVVMQDESSAAGLVQCPDCERRVSRFAPECPKCGFPFERIRQEVAAAKVRERQSLVVAVLMTIGGLIVGWHALTMPTPDLFGAELNTWIVRVGLGAAALFTGLPWLKHWWLYWR